MARAIVLLFNGEPARFAFRKVERSQIYPSKKRAALDVDGAVCPRAQITADGAVLLPGMISQGYYSPAGRRIERSELVPIDELGRPAPLLPSTLDTPAETRPILPEEALLLNASSVYALSPENAAACDLAQQANSGSLCAFPFNYAASGIAYQAFLVSNEFGLFAVAGVPTEPAWIGEPALPDPDDEQPFDEEDLDFEML